MVFSYMVNDTGIDTINKSWDSDFCQERFFSASSLEIFLQVEYIHNNVINSLCIYHYIDSVLQEALVYTSAVKWL